MQISLEPMLISMSVFIHIHIVPHSQYKESAPLPSNFSIKAVQYLGSTCMQQTLIYILYAVRGCSHSPFSNFQH